MKLLFSLSVFFLLVSTVQAAPPPCAINSMNGRWVSYQGAVLVNPHTGVCDFSVVNGTAQGNCNFSTGFKGPFRGNVIVNPDCSVDFDMDFAPAPVITKFQIQLHNDKKSFVGRWENNFGVIGTTNAVKR